MNCYREVAENIGIRPKYDTNVIWHALLSRMTDLPRAYLLFGSYK